MTVLLVHAVVIVLMVAWIILDEDLYTQRTKIIQTLAKP